MSAHEIEVEGREWVRRAISGAGLLALDQVFHRDDAPSERYSVQEVRGVLRETTAMVRIGLPRAQPVRVVFFNKSEANNWALGWHQDRVVALKERIETPGFTNWTNKAGIWHAEPPIDLLQRMLSVRVHLDPATTESGCLQLALGSHRLGKIFAEDADAVASRFEVEDCVAERGDVLIANALLLHRPSPSRSKAGRRAIRIDYCAEELPPPLEWAA
jgi:ectoine hydroxylase-related dioxygenase (phytanoyl-CoA dioxygenase family)